MKRGGPIPRTTPLARGGRPGRNAKRARAAFQRAHGGQTRVEWVSGQPCTVCGRRPSENAHVRTGGMGRKADARWVVPLCPAHHAELHRGQRTFEAAHGIDLAHVAQIVDARWEVYRTQLALFSEAS